MDLNTAYLLGMAGVGFVVGCVFAGFRAGDGAEVTFHSDTGTTTRIRANKPADLLQILRIMREFNPDGTK